MHAVQQGVPGRDRAQVAPAQGASQAEAVPVPREVVQGAIFRALQPVQARQVGARAAAAARVWGVRARVLRAQQAGQARGDGARRAAAVRLRVARLHRRVRAEVRSHAPRQRRAPQRAPLPVPRLQEVRPQVLPRPAPPARARPATNRRDRPHPGRHGRPATPRRPPRRQRARRAPCGDLACLMPRFIVHTMSKSQSFDLIHLITCSKYDEFVLGTVELYLHPLEQTLE